MRRTDAQIDEAFGDRIKTARVQRGLSLLDASRLLKIKLGRLWELEEGTADRGVGLPELYQFSVTYQISLPTLRSIATGGRVHGISII